MEYRIHGLESHAGVAPEEGISAIKIAAEGIAAMTLGRIDEQTTANIGQIEGGMPLNHSQSGGAERRGTLAQRRETRCSNSAHDQMPSRCRRQIRSDRRRENYEGVGGGAIEREYSSMDVADSSHVVQLVLKPLSEWASIVKTMPRRRL